jgi:hypothetical protein
MVGKAGLKAGLIGAVVMVVVTLVNQFVLSLSGALAFVSCGVSLVLYLGIGVLAGWFLAPERTTRTGATAGAIAGLVSAAIGGVVGSVIMVTRVVSTGQIPNMDPQQMQQLAESGMDPTLLISIGAVCGLVLGLAFGAGMAALGGTILAAVKPD